MDLYGRLEELQGMTRLLIDDFSLLKPLVGDLHPDPSDAEKAHRRFYVRAVFALVEAFAEQHRRLLLELADGGVITIREAKLKELREIKDVLDDDGVVVGQREKYLQIFDKIKSVYKAASEGLGQELRVPSVSVPKRRFVVPGGLGKMLIGVFVSGFHSDEEPVPFVMLS